MPTRMMASWAVPSIWPSGVRASPSSATPKAARTAIRPSGSGRIAPRCERNAALAQAAAAASVNGARSAMPRVSMSTLTPRSSTRNTAIRPAAIATARRNARRWAASTRRRTWRGSTGRDAGSGVDGDSMLTCSARWPRSSIHRRSLRWPLARTMPIGKTCRLPDRTVMICSGHWARSSSWRSPRSSEADRWVLRRCPPRLLMRPVWSSERRGVACSPTQSRHRQPCPC